MRFLRISLWVGLLIIHLLPSHYNDPSLTTITGESRETIRFARHLFVDSYGCVLIDWQTMLRPKKLCRPAAVIITLLLACGDIESNPGPVYKYPCTVCSKPVKRNQEGIACDRCNKWTHACCGGVGEMEYLILTAQEGCEWFCPLCIQSNHQFASLSTFDLNTSSTMSMPPKKMILAPTTPLL